MWTLTQRMHMIIGAVWAGKQNRAAAATGVSAQSLGDYLGERTNPPFEYLQRMAREAGVSEAWLIYGRGPMVPGAEETGESEPARGAAPPASHVLAGHDADASHRAPADDRWTRLAEDVVRQQGEQLKAKDEQIEKLNEHIKRMTRVFEALGLAQAEAIRNDAKDGREGHGPTSIRFPKSG